MEVWVEKLADAESVRFRRLNASRKYTGPFGVQIHSFLKVVTKEDMVIWEYMEKAHMVTERHSYTTPAAPEVGLNSGCFTHFQCNLQGKQNTSFIHIQLHEH